MRTTVEIDSALLAEAMRITGGDEPKAIVEAALRFVVCEGERRRALDELWGIGWGDGEIATMRGGQVTVRESGPER